MTAFINISDNIDRTLILMKGFTSHELGFLESLFRLSTQGRRVTMSDLILLVFACLHNTRNDVEHDYLGQGLEFGATEAKGNYTNSSDHLKDALYKLPRTLKDMLDDLVETKPGLIGSLQTVGFIQYGLANTMLQVDRPTEYITRVTRHKTIEISHSIENFGATILPSMLSAWICAEIVNKGFQLLTSSPEEAGEEVFSWMTNYLEKEKVSPMPSISRSTETPSKKKTKTTK